jgi:uncharacterized protein (DUF1684 family)
MDERLRAPNGWLAVAGLFWLHEGLNRVGSEHDAEVVLPEGATPPKAAVIELKGALAVFQRTSPAAFRVDGHPVERVELQPDTSEGTTFVEIGALRLALLRRGDRFAVRVWDPHRRERLGFPGRRWFPVDPDWRVEASYRPNASGMRIRVPNELGEVTEEDSPGRVTFAVAGRTCSLEALEGEEGGLWLIFADASNGKSTYPSGRFLKTGAPDEGRVVVDFNRAYNPPCAFTAFATCPLPPAENRLPVSIEAGERYPISTGDP